MSEKTSVSLKDLSYDAKLSQSYFDAPASSLFDAAEREAKRDADDVTAARAACDAIKRIRNIDLTPAVCGQIAAVLSARVSTASWSHWPLVDEAIGFLDDASDALGAVQCD